MEQLKIDGWSILHRPANSREMKQGAMILLHGYGADEHDLMGLAPFFDEHLDIFCIRAPGQTPFGGASWFDIDMNGQGDLRFNAEQALESCQGVIRLIENMQESGLIQESRIILGGFSQGASVSNLVTLSKPSLVKALLIMSGRLTQGADMLLQDKDQIQDLPVFAGHGTHDQVIPISFGRQIVDFWKQLPVRLEHHEYTMAHEINQNELTDIQVWLDRL